MKLLENLFQSISSDSTSVITDWNDIASELVNHKITTLYVSASLFIQVIRYIESNSSSK
jgi:hypothetical protein